MNCDKPLLSGCSDRRGSTASLARQVVLAYGKVQLLEHFHQRCLRSIMGIKWQHYVTNNEVLERTNICSIEAMLLTWQLRWAGHLSCIEDTRMPKAVFYDEFCEGKHDRGAPRKSWKDQLKRQLTAAGIPQKKTGKTLPETGLAGEQPQSGRQRPPRQRERKPLRRNADEGKCRLYRALQPKDSRVHCVPECAVQGSAFIITRGPVA